MDGPSHTKQYGLIIPGKNKSALASVGTRILKPLQDSDDELEKEESSEETQNVNWVEIALKKSEGGNSGQRALQKRIIREAAQQDATIFQYDEIYDSMKQVNEERKLRQAEAKKPKYIDKILKQSQKRKLENERRNERKVQKERDAEGEEFADKESFVTQSYLNKLEELKQAELEELREKYLEEKIDVQKHKNFGVFYNHLLEQRCGERGEVKQEPKDEEPVFNASRKETHKKNYRTQRDLSESPERLAKSHGRSKSPEKSYAPRSPNNEEDGRSENIGKSMDGHRNRSRSSERHQSRSRSSRKSRNRSRSSGKRKSRSRSVEKHDMDRRMRHKEKSNKERRHARSRDREGREKRSSKEVNGKDSKSENETCTDSRNDVRSMSIEDRIERYQKLFVKKTVGGAFKDALQRYFERKAQPVKLEPC